MDPTTERYLLSEAAEAAGVSLPALRNWVARGHIKFGKSDAPSEIAGAAHRIGFDTVVRLSIVSRLTQGYCNIAPNDAWRFAGSFSESGSGGSGWLGDGALSAPKVRLPGALFDEGYTHLLIGQGSDRAFVENITDDMTWADIAKLIAARDFICIDIGEIYFEVRARLSVLLRRRRSHAIAAVAIDDVQEA